MIKQTKYIISKGYNPYENLALESYLLDTVDKDTCILYLWQNQKTVVIGRNQNAWKECKHKELEEDGGYLARRLSGGGAVYHDLGNLNFTFLVNKKDYDINKQLHVILEAVKSLGINAVKSGRNDIVVDNKKFSGNAFFLKDNNAYHHGTILINVDIDNLTKYLRVSDNKLLSKGVKSVRSRVCNLKGYYPQLDIDMMKKALIKSFELVYKCTPEEINIESINKTEIQNRKNEFSSWDFKFGKKIPFEYQLTHRFIWGDINMLFHIEGGIIVDAAVYSDAMHCLLISELPNYFRGCTFSSNELANTLNRLLSNESSGNETDVIVKDIQKLLRSQNF